MMRQTDEASVGERVLAFYAQLPFNVTETVDQAVGIVKKNDLAVHYGVDGAVLARAVRVLDVGCGVGWLGASIAHHHGATVTGIDFNAVAVARAQALAKAMALSAKFEVADLFHYQPQQPFDLVISFGVLHHTGDCLGALARLCGECVGEGGHIAIGLYHAYGRRPFLEHFARLKAQGLSEDALVERYAAIDPRFAHDRTHLLSWFRDQVMHPHETQHTLEEVHTVLQEAGMVLTRTSINGCKPFGSVSELIEEEKTLSAIGRQKIAEGAYYPGFFTFMAKKTRKAS